MHMGCVNVSNQCNMDLVLKTISIWSKSFEMKRQHTDRGSSFDVGWMRGTLICICSLSFPILWVDSIQQTPITLSKFTYIVVEQPKLDAYRPSSVTYANWQHDTIFHNYLQYDI